jgi:jumonji domain-containing protein 2
VLLVALKLSPPATPPRCNVQFQDFEGYVAECEKQAHEFGIFKVVPPAGWKPRASLYEESDDTVLVAPVRQEAVGQAGIYHMVNIKQRALSVKEFKALASKPENLPPTCSQKEHDAERWELDRRYWQAFAGGRPAVYGADNHSPSLMEDCAGAWNISKLDNLLWQRLKSKGILPGVNSPYLYLGMWRASFAWHVEDMDLYSINFLHWGAEKVWYCANSDDAERLERFGASLFPDQATVCGQFLRHKANVISPSRVVAAGIPLTRVVQRPGEFVISLPCAYHSGFNLGPPRPASPASPAAPRSRAALAPRRALTRNARHGSPAGAVRTQLTAARSRAWPGAAQGSTAPRRSTSGWRGGCRSGCAAGRASAFPTPYAYTCRSLRPRAAARRSPPATSATPSTPSTTSSARCRVPSLYILCEVSCPLPVQTGRGPCAGPVQTGRRPTPPPLAPRGRGRGRATCGGTVSVHVPARRGGRGGRGA